MLTLCTLPLSKNLNVSRTSAAGFERKYKETRELFGGNTQMADDKEERYDELDR